MESSSPGTQTSTMEVRKSRAIGALTIGLIVAANLHVASRWIRLGLAVALAIGIFVAAEAAAALVRRKQNVSKHNGPDQL
jgi:Na+-transporting NADH:ubiquinone oxidoreductase subunit NqrB